MPDVAMDLLPLRGSFTRFSSGLLSSSSKLLRVTNYCALGSWLMAQRHVEYAMGIASTIIQEFSLHSTNEQLSYLYLY
jgi:hypothetical protein